ncbi:helix-turn-helix domain-containing protein [Pseudomonas fluorescens]|uniref:DNA-binding protein n=1 Tax=Pseudomonas fluorescens TaxID=294 RepID=A0A5E7CTI1_PSEFL|nr:helix-turn-helix domain-containing protein [Pseudomonas fluorescens]VVO08450.1 hypothetical protein PS710_03248 [Pseudomonas fluorescens]
MTLPMTSTSLRYVPEREQPDRGASAPSLAEKVFNLFFERATSTAPQMKQAAIFLIDGHPILLSTAHESETSEITQVEKLGLAGQLNEIKEFLGLTVTQLAELFKVTRKTVYDWYDGADPRAGVSGRIETLNHLLQTVAPAIDMKRLKQVWNLPINGESFIDVVNSNGSQHELNSALDRKIHELAPRLVPPARKPLGITSASRTSDLGGIIRDADFSR